MKNDAGAFPSAAAGAAAAGIAASAPSSILILTKAKPGNSGDAIPNQSPRLGEIVVNIRVITRVEVIVLPN